MFTVRVISDISKKTGNPFTCLEITFPNGYKKRVFLEPAEVFMVLPSNPVVSTDETSF